MREMNPERLEPAVDELWRGKRKGERVVADITPRQRKLEEISPPKTPLPPQPEPKPAVEFKRVKKPRQPLGKNFWLRLASVLLVGGVLVAAALVFLPRADITIVLKKSSLSFEEKIEAGKDIASVRQENGRILIPAEFLSAVKNIEFSFPASGREQVELKAQGNLLVYNAFSSEPQVLVANTRFVSPEGKLFRLTRQVTVPGAKVEGGQIIPSSILVAVTADKAGADYNLATSTGQWRIPGFSGTPRYEKFYAEAAGPLTGGFVGERAVPTEGDIELGKEKVEQTLRDVLRSQMLAVAENLKFVEGAASFKVNKMEVSPVADEAGMFSIFAEAEMKQIGFDEDFLKSALVNKLKPSLEANLGYLTESKDFTIAYAQPTVDFEKGTVVFTASGQILFQPPFKAGDFRKEVLGLDEAALRGKAFGIAGLERARLSFWPFWVNEVPRRESRVLITVE